MLALTIDIEDWYHLPAVTGVPSSRFDNVPTFFNKWTSRYDYLSEPTFRVLDMLQDLNMKATFFIVADVVEHYPGLVEKISEKGHEIACHGLHHACKIDPKTRQPLMTKEEFKERTIEARLILEKACGREVIGYRAPNAYIGGWMIDILEEIGFKYDSSVSVNSLYNKSNCQLKNVNSQPYYPSQGSLDLGVQQRRIIEIPWPYFKHVVKFPTGGGPVLRFFGSGYIIRGLKESLTRGNTTFYFHPIDISRESFPSCTTLTQHSFWAVKGDNIEKRVRKILSTFADTTGTCRQLLSKEMEIYGC